MFYHSITMIQIYINKPNESFRNTLSDIEKAKKKKKNKFMKKVIEFDVLKKINSRN